MITLTYIITTYNRQALLERAIGYVARERCAGSELIVVDDNSYPRVTLSNQTMAVFSEGCQLIRNPVNLGVIGARNVGIAAARGRFLLFLDDDDESFMNRTGDLLAAISDTDLDFAAARASMQLGDTDKIVPAQAGFMLTPQLLLLHPPHINAVIWRRESFRTGLDDRIPYFGEHISMLLCLLRGGKSWLSPAVVARFGYINNGLTQIAQQQHSMKRYLTSLYGLLLAESNAPGFSQLCERVLTMLNQEEIRDFDDYLHHLQPLVERPL
jgi:glycosyltransferase involved in cell wall biosynthesis